MDVPTGSLTTPKYARKCLSSGVSEIQYISSLVQRTSKKVTFSPGVKETSSPAETIKQEDPPWIE